MTNYKSIRLFFSVPVEIVLNAEPGPGEVFDDTKAVAHAVEYWLLHDCTDGRLPFCVEQVHDGLERIARAGFERAVTDRALPLYKGPLQTEADFAARDAPIQSAVARFMWAKVEDGGDSFRCSPLPERDLAAETRAREEGRREGRLEERYRIERLLLSRYPLSRYPETAEAIMAIMAALEACDDQA